MESQSYHQQPETSKAKQSAAAPWQRAAAALASVGALFGASCATPPVDTVASSGTLIEADYWPDLVVQPPIELDVAPQILVDFDVPPLDTTAEAILKASLVQVVTYVKEGYDVLPSVCTGVHIGNGLIMTAAHCIKQLGRAGTGQIYAAEDTAGNSIVKQISIRSTAGETPVAPENIFTYERFGRIDDPRQDAAILKVPELVGLPNFPNRLEADYVQRGQRAYIGSWLQDRGPILQGATIVKSPSANDLEYDQVLSVYAEAIYNGHESCASGQSGGPVLWDGRVIGIQIRSTPKPVAVTPELAHEAAIQPAMTGRTFKICRFLGLRAVQPLINQASR